ncbi:MULTISPECIES: alpha/beta hydrolase [unclassified Mycobacterium]|uniref:alpha/beta hydrolase n=1 Tax=unclassified Mycobacterium TaxID=2642494 RepID=UPI0029C7F618|nr:MULTISPECIES: alpha/beta hydrolase [unclassified Mycobacterium]
MKRVLAVAALGLTGLTFRKYVSARRTLAKVAVELRNPVLAVVPISFNARTLPFFRAVMRFGTKAGPGVVVSERAVGAPAVRVLVMTPSEQGGPRPAVLWIHGGGMIAGSPQFEAAGSARLARDLNAIVVSPDYRLAPENPFPAGLDDCMATLRWMRANAEELGLDPDRIAVMGASAGGGLSAAVAQRSHDEGGSLRAQVLVYPMLDDRSTLTTDHAERGQIAWTPSSNRFGWTAYLGREPRMSDAPEYAAPVRRTNLAGLPPAWIGVGGLDVFCPESVEYADNLTTSGVPCTLLTVPGMYHGADGVAPKAKSMKEFRRSMMEHLKAHL